jgi:Bacteriophage lambda head decoration protein D
MPLIKNEPIRSNDWLIFEDEGIARYSRESGTVALSQTLVSGTVISFNATGDIVRLGTSAPSNVARGILVDAVTTDATTKQKAPYIARFAAVASDILTFDVALTAPQKTTALSELNALGIVRRASV